MRINPTYVKFSLLFAVSSLLVAAFLIPSALTQTRERRTAPSTAEANIKVADIIKTDVDLVTIDALVLRKNTSRVVGSLKQEDFLVSEDGTRRRFGNARSIWRKAPRSQKAN